MLDLRRRNDDDCGRFVRPRVDQGANSLEACPQDEILRLELAATTKLHYKAFVFARYAVQELGPGNEVMQAPGDQMQLADARRIADCNRAMIKMYW